MKQLLLSAVACLFFILQGKAQIFPYYGIISGNEKELKECSFDKDANAIILLHEATSDYDDEYHLITTHHVRIKILKEAGLSVADVSIPFYRKDDFENIYKVEGMTFNYDAQGNEVITKLDRKSIFTKKTNERIGEVVIAFPAVKVGSIIEYQYESVMRNYNGLDDWDFQDRLPVLASKYTLVIIPNAEFAYQVSKTSTYPIVIKKQEYRGGIFFEMDSIPGLGNESYMDARRDYLQKVIFQLSGFTRGGSKNKYMSSWDEVSRDLLAEPAFGPQLNKSIQGTGDFIKGVKVMPTDEDKMKAVFNYVRSNMVWNNLYSKYSADGVKDAWQKKGGTSGDINLTLVNLLKEAGLDANPVLVSERFHGKVNTAYPFLDQFNSVFAYVVINKKKYFLDATNTTLPPHLTPIEILNTTGYVYNRKTGGLIEITNDSLQFKENVSGAITISPQGTVDGELSVYSFDYARVEKIQEYKRDKKKFISDNFEVPGTTIGAKDVTVENMDKDSLGFIQTARVSGNLNTTGEYSFVPLNIFTGYSTNPFISTNRFSNINFGYRRLLNFNITFQLPETYMIDELPKSMRLITPDKDISFLRQVEYSKEDNQVRCIMQIEFKESLYPADAYPMIKEVYQKLFDYLKEPIVLKKKSPGN
ncbi:hypothetical protein BH11BAC3_BH11BAC3_40390 [soil metagenome]